MASDGLLLWANSIRTTMASDKARFEFAEHMQSRGFSWLDQYLEDVLEKAREGDDELFDLMKTPGRKKAGNRKAPTTGSRLKNITTITEQDEDMESKENVAPTNNTFYQALLAAKSPEPAKPPADPRAPDSSPLPEQTLRRISSHPREPSPPLPTPTFQYQDTLGFPQLPQMDPVALSMIIEDDEVSGRVSSHGSYAAERAPLQSVASSKLANEVIKEQAEDMDISGPRPTSWASTTDTFHSIPASEFDQPPTASEPVAGPSKAASEDPFVRDEATSPLEDKPSVYPTLPSGEYEDTMAMHLPSQDAPELKSEDVVPEPQPPAGATQYMDGVVPLRDDDTTTGPRPPSPLRKSLRAVREQSSGAILVGNATPGPAVGGQRTSWLMKTRAVNRKVSGLGGPAHVPRTTLGGTKRKSEDTMHIPGLPSEDDTRHAKAMKMLDTDAAPGRPGERAESAQPPSKGAGMNEEGILDRLRKTMQGMKPVGPTVTNEALADAKASAEAKVAERHQADTSVVSNTVVDAQPASSEAVQSAAAEGADASPGPEASRRMSVSELMPSNDKATVFKFAPPAQTAVQHTARVSTTPANSPPAATRELPAQPPPVFSKPPVFVPPPGKEKPAAAKEFHFQPAAVRNAPTSLSTVGLSPRLVSPPSHKATALSAQSTVESLTSDKVFDNDVEIPGSWDPTTQDTEYTAFGETQKTQDVDIVEDWSDDEPGQPFPMPANPTDTYSTMSTASHKLGLSVNPTTDNHAATSPPVEEPAVQEAPVAREEEEIDLAETNVYFMDVDGEKETQPVKASTPTEDERPASQLSDASSVQPTTLLGHAHKFMSSMLGSGKKAKAVKPEVKSLQLAAAAAKKEQDEREKKEKRMKEMENRRLLAAQRKADEEKARKEEQERKAAEDRERRKREREETTGKLPVPVARAGAAKEEDTTKKRKIELQKQPSKSALKPTLHLPGSTTKTLTKSHSKTALAGSSTTPAYKAAEAKSVPSLKGKGKAPAKVEDDSREPAQVLQSSMAARAKAQMQAAQAAAEPQAGPSENIELPDINSEYSDSDDEDRGRDVADWAQSPDLARMLRVQSTINPDDIFGEIRPLRMEEMFKTRQSRFRARTSSANWTGTDRLTVEEEREYARRMGYR